MQTMEGIPASKSVSISSNAARIPPGDFALFLGMVGRKADAIQGDDGLFGVNPPSFCRAEPRLVEYPVLIDRCAQLVQIHGRARLTAEIGFLKYVWYIGYDGRHGCVCLMGEMSRVDTGGDRAKEGEYHQADGPRWGLSCHFGGFFVFGGRFMILCRGAIRGPIVVLV